MPLHVLLKLIQWPSVSNIIPPSFLTVV